MTRNEQQMYSDITSIRKSLEKIANALDNNVLDNVNYKPEINPADLCNEKNDELYKLVQNLCNNDYLEFCSIHNLPSNDAVFVSNYIAELDYEECLDAIKVVENIVEEFKLQNMKYETDLQGLRVDSDHDIRSTASFYEIEYIEKHGATKKECILDYVTNEFGLHGARYTDIIKFAYYLGAHNAPKYDATRDRGYYSCAFSPRMNGHLVQGGKDYLVKGINKEGDERYFALSNVESFTDYYKRIE